MKTALVTGANRGIGLEVARQLIGLGFQVHLGCRNREDGLQAADDLGPAAHALELDVSKPESIREAVSSLSSLDVLVNNAGIYDQSLSSILDLSAENLETSLTVNSLGPLRLAQACWPLLSQSPDAHIINVSSGLGQLSEMGDEPPAYCLSKTLLNAVTRQLAAAGRPSGIRVNSVCPGWVRTEMGGPGASRSVEEGADTIVWLAREAPRSLTGQFLRDREPIPW